MSVLVVSQCFLLLVATALFADAPDVVSGASLFACVAAAISGFFAWLTTREKLKHDAKMHDLEGEVKLLKFQHAECKEDHAEHQTLISSLRSEQIQSKRDRDHLQQQVADLKRRADAKSGPHTPLPEDHGDA